MPWINVTGRLVEMPGNTTNRDLNLIKDCANGSERAWEELYSRFAPLVRSVVKRKLWFAPNEVEDVTQMVFAALVDSLEKYDGSVSLARYICMIAERICIQEYRKNFAAKRDGETVPVEHHDRADSEEVSVRTLSHESPESLMETGQLTEILKRSLRALDSDCRRLLRLRYFNEMSYKEISLEIGDMENTLSVRARRCLDSLRALCHELMREKPK
jgi:RNA polymerase sigma-70 factor (ECF subfamily)